MHMDVFRRTQVRDLTTDKFATPMIQIIVKRDCSDYSTRCKAKGLI
jgi:hypothetical protein